MTGLVTLPAMERSSELIMPHAETTTHRPSLTKVVATLGPATDDDHCIRRLIENGASVFRLNFSHGNEDDQRRRLEQIRRVSEQLDAPVAVLGDLPGPKIRVSEVGGDGIELTAGQDFWFRRGVKVAEPADEPVFGCTYESIVDEVEAGHRVLINDGAIRALVTETTDGAVRCRVITGGRVTTGKGVNLPDSDISAPAITERDWRWVRFAVENGLDYLALSFVRRADEVRELKAALERWCEGGKCGTPLSGFETVSTIPVIAKIEKPQAVKHIDEILEEAAGIMVARGDLGVEMDLAQVPIIQKLLIAKAREYGKPCIVATQMLETMIERPTPTRAEASDVANAIFDRTDAVMLSGETAVGRFPHLAVETMRRIALATEERLRELPAVSTPSTKPREEQSRTNALAHGAWHIANDLNAKLVVAWSENGGSARLLSRIGLHIPIIAFSSSESAVRRMALLYGVTPVLARELPLHRSDFGLMIDRVVIERGWAAPGDTVVAIAGKPFGKPGVVNTVAVRTLTDPFGPQGDL